MTATVHKIYAEDCQVCEAMGQYDSRLATLKGINLTTHDIMKVTEWPQDLAVYVIPFVNPDDQTIQLPLYLSYDNGDQVVAAIGEVSEEDFTDYLEGCLSPSDIEEK